MREKMRTKAEGAGGACRDRLEDLRWTDPEDDSYDILAEDARDLARVAARAALALMGAL